MNSEDTFEGIPISKLILDRDPIQERKEKYRIIASQHIHILDAMRYHNDTRLQNQFREKKLRERKRQEYKDKLLKEKQAREKAKQLAEEKKKAQEAERRRREWKPQTEADELVYTLIQGWDIDFKPEVEKFFHAAFVLVYYLDRRHGVCFTGGIERWGKDRNKLKPFGGRREEKENRRQTAIREFKEETAGMMELSESEIGECPHVFILRTNPIYLYKYRINHHEFRNRLKNQTDPHHQEMKAVVHIPFKNIYAKNIEEISHKGVKVNDITGRKTQLSSFFLNALRGFGFI